MGNFLSQHIIGKIIEKGKVEITLCDNPMECNDGCFFALHKRNELVIKELIDEYEDKNPLNITRVEINIFPGENNVKYYSFKGIEEIVKNLFQVEQEKIKKQIQKSDAYFKVYFFRDDFYTIPAIRIEIIFLSTLSDEVFSFLSGVLHSNLKSLIRNN